MVAGQEPAEVLRLASRTYRRAAFIATCATVLFVAQAALAITTGVMRHRQRAELQDVIRRLDECSAFSKKCTALNADTQRVCVGLKGFKP